MSSAITTAEDAYLAAQTLNADQKLELISRLWEDVRLSGTFRPSDSDLAEIKRRWADYKSGKEHTVPWDEVRDEVRRILDSHAKT